MTKVTVTLIFVLSHWALQNQDESGVHPGPTYKTVATLNNYAFVLMPVHTAGVRTIVQLKLCQQFMPAFYGDCYGNRYMATF